MKILITPSDLIKRFVWDKYQDYILDGKNTADINKIIKDDEEFEISEDDAFVIGLTNVVYTTEVIYKFKQFLREILDNKNFEQDNRLYINRQFLLDSIHDFKSKIPKSWVSDDSKFNDELAQLPTVYVAFEKGVNTLVTINVQEWPCVKYAQVKKIINKL
jgi:hypothetical protein